MSAMALMSRELILKVYCSGNQPHSFEVLFYSIDANNSCSFTKQYLTFKQAARLVSFYFVLCNQPTFDS